MKSSRRAPCSYREIARLAVAAIRAVEAEHIANEASWAKVKKTGVVHPPATLAQILGK